MLSKNKLSIQEVTHESPPHNSRVATQKGPLILPWKVYKLYISLKKKKEIMSQCMEKKNQKIFIRVECC